MEAGCAYSNEDFGPDNLLGRACGREVVLPRLMDVEIAV